MTFISCLKVNCFSDIGTHWHSLAPLVKYQYSVTKSTKCSSTFMFRHTSFKVRIRHKDITKMRKKIAHNARKLVDGVGRNSFLFPPLVQSNN